MNQLPLEQQALLILQAAALVGLLGRIWWTRLYRTYSYFFGYLVVALLQVAIGPLIPLRSRMYLYVWMASEALVISFYVLVVLETYAVILRDLPGIASVARHYIKIALAVAALSILLVGLEKRPATMPQYFGICERSLVSSLLVFVLLSVVFLAYYPVPLSRNAVTYSVGFAVYLLAKTATLFVNNIGYYWWERQINSLLLGVSSACMLFWLLSLSPAGEKRTMVVGYRWGGDEEKRMLSRLKAINESLLRTAKK
jgi:hypothetical protein